MFAFDKLKSFRAPVGGFRREPYFFRKTNVSTKTGGNGEKSLPFRRREKAAVRRGFCNTAGLRSFILSFFLSITTISVYQNRKTGVE